MEGLEWEWFELSSRSCPSVRNTHHCLSLQNSEKVKGGGVTTGWMHFRYTLQSTQVWCMEYQDHSLCAILVSLSVSLSLLTSFSSLLFFTFRLIPLSCCDGSFFRCMRALQAAICSIWQFTLAKPLSNRIICWPLVTSTQFLNAYRYRSGFAFCVHSQHLKYYSITSFFCVAVNENSHSFYN